MVNIASSHEDLKRSVDHIGVSASFVIHDGKGNVLLQKRGMKARDEQGRWDTGGGALEFGETLEAAISREIGEEYLAKPVSMSFLLVNDVHRNHNGVKTHWISIVYEVLVNPSEIKIGEPDKIAEIGWFTTKNLPSPLHSQLHKALAAAKAVNIIL